MDDRFTVALIFHRHRLSNRPSWMDVLHFMSDAWQNRRAELEEQAGKLIDHIHSANHFYAGLEKNIAVPETNSLLQLNAGPLPKDHGHADQQWKVVLGAPQVS